MAINIEQLKNEERAYLSRLLSLNSFFEAAKAGPAASELGYAAQASNALLECLLAEIKATHAN